MLVSKMVVFAASLLSQPLQHSRPLSICASSSIAFFHGKLPQPIVYNKHEKPHYVSFVKVVVHPEETHESEILFHKVVENMAHAKGCIAVTPYGDPKDKKLCMFAIEWKDIDSYTTHAQEFPDMGTQGWGALQRYGNFPLMSVPAHK